MGERGRRGNETISTTKVRRGRKEGERVKKQEKMSRRIKNTRRAG